MKLASPFPLQRRGKLHCHSPYYFKSSLAIPSSSSGLIIYPSYIINHLFQIPTQKCYKKIVKNRFSFCIFDYIRLKRSKSQEPKFMSHSCSYFAYGDVLIWSFLFIWILELEICNLK